MSYVVPEAGLVEGAVCHPSQEGMAQDGAAAVRVRMRVKGRLW